MDKPMEQMLREYRSNRDEIVELQQKLRELPGSESRGPLSDTIMAWKSAGGRDGQSGLSCCRQRWTPWSAGSRRYRTE